MQPLDAERRVIEAAEALARTLGDDDNHSVAAAAMDIDGRIHRGVNVYHFTGGPCAELVALGAVATNGATQVLAIAAASDRDRGLIPPCGRCRQVLLDHHPDIFVALPSPSGPVMRPVWKLLPDAYRSPDARVRRVVRFHQRYHDAVLSGEKTSTVRWDEPIAVGPASFVFEGRPDFAHVDGEVLSVEGTSLQDLDAAHADGLRTHYPSMPADAELTSVTFRVLPA